MKSNKIAANSANGIYSKSIFEDVYLHSKDVGISSPSEC